MNFIMKSLPIFTPFLISPCAFAKPLRRSKARGKSFAPSPVGEGWEGGLIIQKLLPRILHKIRFDKSIQISVENCLYVSGLMIGAMVFNHFVRMQGI